jgi:hypothetical protein
MPKMNQFLCYEPGFSGCLTARGCNPWRIYRQEGENNNILRVGIGKSKVWMPKSGLMRREATCNFNLSNNANQRAQDEDS